MKNLILLLCFFIAFNCDKPSPLDVEIYKLDNGLTVMLNEDHNETSVFGAIVVDIYIIHQGDHIDCKYSPFVPTPSSRSFL